MLRQLAALSESLRGDNGHSEVVKAEWHALMTNIQRDMEEVPLCLNLWEDAQTYVTKGCPERAAAVCATIASVWPHLAPKHETQKSHVHTHAEPKSVPKPKRMQSRSGLQRKTSFLSPVHKRLSDSAPSETKQWATPTCRTTATSAQPGSTIDDSRSSTQFTAPARRQSRSSAQHSTTPTTADIFKGIKSDQIFIASSGRGGQKAGFGKKITTVGKRSLASDTPALRRRTQPPERPRDKTLGALAAEKNGGVQLSSVRTGSTPHITWKKQAPPSRLSHNCVREESPHRTDTPNQTAETWTTPPGSPDARKRSLAPKGGKMSSPHTETTLAWQALRLPPRGSPMRTAAALRNTVASPQRKGSSLQSAPHCKPVQRTLYAAEERHNSSPTPKNQLPTSSLRTGPSLSATKVAPPSPLQSAPLGLPTKRSITPPSAAPDAAQGAGRAGPWKLLLPRNCDGAVAERSLDKSYRVPSSSHFGRSRAQPSAGSSSCASPQGPHLVSTLHAGIERVKRSEYDSPSPAVDSPLSDAASVSSSTKARLRPSLLAQYTAFEQSQTGSAKLSAAIAAPPIGASQMITRAPAAIVGAGASSPTLAPAKPLPAVGAGGWPSEGTERSEAKSWLSGVTSASSASAKLILPLPTPSEIQGESQRAAAESSTTMVVPCFVAPQVADDVPAMMKSTGSSTLSTASLKPAQPVIAERLPSGCEGPSTTKASAVRSPEITPRVATPPTLAGLSPIADTETLPPIDVSPALPLVVLHAASASLSPLPREVNKPINAPALSMVLPPTNAARSRVVAGEESLRVATSLRNAREAPASPLVKEESSTPGGVLPTEAQPLTGVVLQAYSTGVESLVAKPKPALQRASRQTNTSSDGPSLNAHDAFRATVVSPTALTPSLATDAQVMADLAQMMCEQSRFGLPNNSNVDEPKDDARVVPARTTPVQVPIRPSVGRKPDDDLAEPAPIAPLEVPIRLKPCPELEDAASATNRALMAPPPHGPVSLAPCTECSESYDASSGKLPAPITPRRSPLNATPWGVPMFPETIQPVHRDTDVANVVRSSVPSVARKSRGSNILAMTVMDIDAQSSMQDVPNEAPEIRHEATVCQTTPNNEGGEERATVTPLREARPGRDAVEGEKPPQVSGAAGGRESAQSSGTADGWGSMQYSGVAYGWGSSQSSGTQESVMQGGTNDGQHERQQIQTRSHSVAAEHAKRRPVAAWGIGLSANLPWGLNRWNTGSGPGATFASGASGALPRPMLANPSIGSSALRRSLNWSSSRPLSLIAPHLYPNLPNPQPTGPASSTNAPLQNTAVSIAFAHSLGDRSTAPQETEMSQCVSQKQPPIGSAASHSVAPTLLCGVRPTFLRSGSTGNLITGIIPRRNVAHRASMPQLPLARDVLARGDAAHQPNTAQESDKPCPALTLQHLEGLGEPNTLRKPVIQRNSLPAHGPRMSIRRLSASACSFPLAAPPDKGEVGPRGRTPSPTVIRRRNGPSRTFLLTSPDTSTYVTKPQKQAGVHYLPKSSQPDSMRGSLPATKNATVWSLPRTVWGQSSAHARPLQEEQHHKQQCLRR